MWFDPFDKIFLADPYPVYEELRKNYPVYRHAATAEAPEFWALSRFDDIWHAVRSPALFSSAQGLTFFADEIAKLGLPPNLVMLDPPRHTRLRRLIGRNFTPRNTWRFAAAISGIVQERIAVMQERVASGEPIDLH